MDTVLSGIRVLDFGRYVAGPYCAALLGYLGADVIRVERPGGGEDRRIAPLGPDAPGASFMQMNCNKRSLTLRLSADGAREIVARLVASSDVVVANLPPSALTHLALDYESLRRIRDDVILANVTAFGNGGDWAERRGFDGVGQAMSGAVDFSGMPGAPAKAAAPYVDVCSGVLTALGVMAALRYRDRTGQGQQVSSSLLGTALTVFNAHLVEQAVAAPNRTGTGNRVQTSSPSDVFETSDGHVLVHCPGDAIFRRWARLLQLDDWLDDPRFRNDEMRGKNRDVLCAPMAKWCAERRSDQVLDILADAGIPAGPVLSAQQALDHPQTQALGLLASVEFPGIPQPAPVAGTPFELSAVQTGIRERPPLPGEHTDSILTELGFESDQIDSLRRQGVI